MSTYRPSFFRVLWLLVLVFLLAACSANNSNQTATTEPASPNETDTLHSGYPPSQEAGGYPIPSDVQSPYPGPDGGTVEQPQIYPTITVVPELGQVEGIILRNDKPVVNVVMYVSEVIKDNKGTNVSVKFDRTSSLNAVTDNNGKFVIPNIPSGDYGLVLDAVVNTLLLSNPKSNEQIILKVENGSRIDLGAMNYSELPIP